MEMERWLIVIKRIYTDPGNQVNAIVLQIGITVCSCPACWPRQDVGDGFTVARQAPSNHHALCQTWECQCPLCAEPHTTSPAATTDETD
jgi:hypothetical protein